MIRTQNPPQTMDYLPGYRILRQFLTTSITDKPKSFWTFISKLRQDNQGIGDLHVSGSIVSADALEAEALNEQFNSVYTEEGSIPLPNLGENPFFYG